LDENRGNGIQKYGFDIERVVMKTTLHYEKYELVIGRNLDWLRELLDC
jgi:hypothetical protein